MPRLQWQETLEGDKRRKREYREAEKEGETMEWKGECQGGFFRELQVGCS